jgi:hypothetical protein
MKNSQLKRQITNKYGTLTRFCHLTGLNYVNTHRALEREDKSIQDTLIPLIEKTEFARAPQVEVTQQLINSVKIALEKTGIPPTTWAKANNITPNRISVLLNGGMKRKSRVVRDICDKLGVK